MVRHEPKSFNYFASQRMSALRRHMFAINARNKRLTTTSLVNLMQVPPAIARVFSLFPLHTFPPIKTQSGKHPDVPTLWIHPPQSATSRLSTDVECLKWQAYLALRGLSKIAVRCDIDPQGAMGARLPNLHLANGQLLPAQLIPTWADEVLEEQERPLEGYKDQAALDESRAWVSLLEGDVHAALVRALAGPCPRISHSSS